MTFPVPSPEGIQAVLSLSQTPTHIGTGGFKAVYRMETKSGIEAIKAVYVPPAGGEKEDSIRDQLIARAEREIDALVQHIDFAPTVLEAFGVKVPDEFEGRTLWPLLEGKEKDHYDAIFSNQGLWSSQRVMRTKEWSLVKTIEPGMLISRPPTELYDRRNDLAESKDLAPEKPDVVDELELKYYRWLENRLGNRPDPMRIICREPIW